MERFGHQKVPRTDGYNVPPFNENIADSLFDGNEFPPASMLFFLSATIHIWINKILLVG
jgi:hypothetical protein